MIRQSRPEQSWRGCLNYIKKDNVYMDHDMHSEKRTYAERPRDHGRRDQRKVVSNRMRLLSVLLAVILLGIFSACQRYEPTAMLKEDPAASARAREAEKAAEDGAEEDGNETGPVSDGTGNLSDGAAAFGLQRRPERTPVKVKGIYLGANAAGVSDFMDKVIRRIDETELNAVVIDVKDDYGRITYAMDSVPLVNELGAVDVKISDMPGVIKKLKQHGIYCIARVVALKDPFIAEQKPEWALHLADGTVFRDNKGDAWVDPYKQEYWDYLVDVSKAAGEIGFDEIQFDYIRFCTESGIDRVVYDGEETQGRDKISIISELVGYVSGKLRAEGLFVSCDVFGTIIGSPVDAQSVGQDYTEMASEIDYICPMIYPSHYAAGNFGLEHPDKQPYETILGALNKSKAELTKEAQESGQAIVRPWLQSFTASYLGEGNYIPYNAETTREQIRAVYDAGYDEWILWSASANYYYDGLLTPEAAEAEAESIAQSRAALPEGTETAAQSSGAGGDGTAEGSVPAEGSGVSVGNGATSENGSAAESGSGPAQNGTEMLPAELREALPDGELSESDRAILEQEGSVIITENGE